MKVTTQELGNCEVLMTVEIDDKQKNRLLEKAARRISRQVKIPGFRPGKVPYRIVINKFGVEAVQEEALSDLTKDVFQQALEEAEKRIRAGNIVGFCSPSLNIITENPCLLNAFTCPLAVSVTSTSGTITPVNILSLFLKDRMRLSMLS